MHGEVYFLSWCDMLFYKHQLGTYQVYSAVTYKKNLIFVSLRLLNSVVYSYNVVRWLLVPHGVFSSACMYPTAIVNPLTAGNTWVWTPHYGYWWPGAEAPGHQYPLCWWNIIWDQFYTDILHLKGTNNLRKMKIDSERKKIPICLRVNQSNKLNSYSDNLDTWRPKQTLFFVTEDI